MSYTNVPSNGGIGFPACAISEVIPLKLNVHFDCDLVLNLLSLKKHQQTALEKQDSYPILLNSLPLRSDNIKLRAVEADYEQIRRCLQEGISLTEVPHKRIHLVMRLKESQVEIVRIPPLALEICRLCNGKLNVSDILKTFAKRHPTVDAMSGSKACLYGLNLLNEQKLIRIAHPDG